MLWLFAKYGSGGDEVVVWNGKGGAFVMFEIWINRDKAGVYSCDLIGA